MWRRLAFAVIALFSMATARHGYAVESPWTLGHFQHTSWTTKDGAPSDIAALAQTSDGYLWIGSTRGLYRFDGIRFVHFEPVAGETLPSSQIYSLFAPASGGLWISYEGSGVSFLKNGHLENYGAKEGQYIVAALKRHRQALGGNCWLSIHHCIVRELGGCLSQK